MAFIRIFSLTCLLVTGCSFSNDKRSELKLPWEVIETSDEYFTKPNRYPDHEVQKIRLNNGLEAFLIYNPNASNSGASLSVKAGAWNDPKERAGMAHFVEHMLFYSTKNGPNQDILRDFLSKNSGHTNAYTAQDKTTYFFSCQNSAFKQGLTYFSELFDPTFIPEPMENEISAINEEYLKRGNNSFIILLNMLKENPLLKNTVWNKFLAGNRLSLEGSQTEEVQKWYKNHYYADQMKLAIFSKEPLSEITPLIHKLFSKLPSSPGYKPGESKTPKIYDTPPYKTEPGALYQLSVPELQKTLFLTWPIALKSTPDHLDTPTWLAAFFGSNHQGGLYDQLKKKGYIESLSTDTHVASNLTSQMTVVFSLTDKGWKEYQTVIETFYSYLHALQNEIAPQHLQDEAHQLSLHSFHYADLASSQDIASAISANLCHESINTYPYFSVVNHKRFFETGKQLLQQVKPQTQQTILIADSETWEKEGVKLEKQVPNYPKNLYNKVTLSKELLYAWDTASQFIGKVYAPPNPFIPDQIPTEQPITQEAKNLQPKKVLNEPQGELYFLKDEFFGGQKSYITGRIYGDSFTTEPRQILLRTLLTRCYTRIYQEELSQVGNSGLSLLLSPDYRSIRFTARGWELLPLKFTQKVFEQIQTLTPTEEDLKREIEQEIIEIKDASKVQPYQIAISAFDEEVEEEMFDRELALEILPTITLEELIDYSRHVFQGGYMQAIALSGSKEDQFVEEYQKILGQMQGTPGPTYHMPPLKAFDGQTFKLNSEMEGNAICKVLDGGPYTYPRKAAANILSQAIDMDYFELLRTVKKVAYIAHSGASDIRGRIVLLFIAQSGTSKSEPLNQMTEEFLSEQSKRLEELVSKERFEETKGSMLANLDEPYDSGHETISNLSYFLWSLPYKDGFSTRTRYKNALQELDYETFIQIAKELTDPELSKSWNFLVQEEFEESSLESEDNSSEEAA